MTPADFMVIAYRGASAYAPENTLAAFDLALQMGCRHLELDVDLTRDGHIVVMHDETVDRTTNGTGPVGNHTLAELRAYAPELPTGWRVSEVSDATIAQAHALGLTQIGPRADTVTPALVHRLHAEGFVVLAWGVADEALMRQVVDAGADGMTVNFPDRLLAYLQGCSRG